MTRRPAVAGSFYPAKPDELRAMIEEFTPVVPQKVQALGALCPHAGYVFSGPVAGRLFASIRVPDSVILLNPSHRFDRPAFALWTGGNWQTPLCEVTLHETLTAELAKLPLVTPEDRPHVPEHSAEVVLPFIQYHRPDVKVAFICVTAAAGLDELKELGRSLAEVIDRAGLTDALVVASSDMSHESGPRALEIVNRHDPLAIEQMRRLDPDGLYSVCMREHVTMCGVLPAVAMMACVQARGGTAGEVIGRATSADSPYGNSSYVVGYVSMVFV